jgi:hypothetical protein
MNRDSTRISSDDESTRSYSVSFKNSSLHGVNIFNFGNLTLGVSEPEDIVKQIESMNSSGDRETNYQQSTVIGTKKPEYDSEYKPRGF